MKYKPWDKSDRRARAWWHNSLRGQVAFARKGMQAISNSDTCSETARNRAATILSELLELEKEMETRVD
jgi:hypothetical protein